MGRKRSKSKKKLRIQDNEVHHTNSGTFTRGTANLADLLQHVHMAVRPGQPWGDDETHQRWNDSAETGHRQLFLKCQNCSLEFVLLTLRTEIEALESYQPSHGRHGGLCANLTCPECGEKGRSVLLGICIADGPIYVFVSNAIQIQG